MRRQDSQSLSDVATSLTGALVFLDIDGTVVADGGEYIADDTHRAVTQLAARNTVYIVSNGTDAARVERIGAILGVPIAPVGVPAGKPRARAAYGIDRTGHKVVVLGDKYLTDGLFARRIGATFLPVIRVRDGNERLGVRISYWIERVVSWFL